MIGRFLLKKYIANLTLSGIIMAVTDVFDALTSKRSYKEPFPFAESVSIISDEAGKASNTSATAIIIPDNVRFAIYFFNKNLPIIYNYYRKNQNVNKKSSRLKKTDIKHKNFSVVITACKWYDKHINQ